MRTWTLESRKLGFCLWVHFFVCKIGSAMPASRELKIEDLERVRDT